MSNDKTPAAPMTEDEVHTAFEAINISPTSSQMDSVLRPNENLAITRRTWHSAVLAECATIGACYQESDPAKTVRDLIDWHRKDAVWHHDQEAAGRVAASLDELSEPVAWMHPSGGVIQTRRTGLEKDTYTIPLYLAASTAPVSQAAEPALPENQSRELDADIAAQNYCRSMWGAARGYPDWRRYHDAFVAGYLAKPAPPAQKADAEPVLYQYRMAPAWDETPRWQDWVDCSAASYADYARLPVYNDWKYEARKLYITPQAPAMTSAELQSYEMHIAQADEIREILNALAPETEGNLQTRITQALTNSERLDAMSYRYLRQISCNTQFDESELYKAFSAAGYTEEPPTEEQFDSVIRGIVAAKDAA